MADEQTLQFSVNGGIDAAATARSTVTDGLGPDVAQRTIEDVLLVISELVTNAVRHAGADTEGDTIEVTVRKTGRAVRIEVADSAPATEPQLRRDDAPGGMGLVVVSGLCPQWGTEQEEGRKTVWAEYPLQEMEAQAS
jgi:anti-sigma regulatory factor (Ser/Thr protein kinase)